MMMTNDEYIATRGLLCPCCQSNDIGVNDSEYYAAKHFEYAECYDCGKTWTAEYQLIGYTLDETLPNLDTV